MKILISKTELSIYSISREIYKLNVKIGQNEERLLTAKMNGDKTEIFFVENEIRKLNIDREELIERLNKY